jgi:hypothetical protein
MPQGRLTLRRVMGAIAALALAFAFLPTTLSATLAVTVAGVLALEGMHFPLLTTGTGARRWFPWAVWSLTLMACPVAITIVGVLCQTHVPGNLDGPATRAVFALAFAQFGVSVIASIVVVVLARGAYRWLAWAGVLVIGALTDFVHAFAAMATTGYYL